MANAEHVAWLAEGTVAWNRRRKAFDFVPDLTGLRFATLVPDPDASETWYTSINLCDADLDGADLTGVSFQAANFIRARMRGCNMQQGRLTACRFDGADLSSANAYGANLRRATFRGAGLSDMDMTGADASYADFGDSTLTQLQLDRLADQKYARLPQSLRPIPKSEDPPAPTVAPESPPNASASWIDRPERQALIDPAFFPRALASRIAAATPPPPSPAKPPPTAPAPRLRSISRGIVSRLAGFLGISKQPPDPGLAVSGIGFHAFDAFAPGPEETPETPPEADGIFYHVYYATNRQEQHVAGRLTGYGPNRDDRTHYGLCRVFIPASHRIGSTGSSFLGRLLRGDDRLKLSELVDTNSEIFFRNIASLWSQADLTIFVHGFRTSFEQGALRAAQIGRDLGIEEGIALFSWPSSGELLDYSADEDSAAVAKYALAEFLVNCARALPEGRINIIAHSMGCRCLMLALEMLGTAKEPALGRLGQVILAAADVDQEAMRKFGHHATQHARRATCYVSEQDKAVQASQLLHNYARVGLSPPIFVMEGWDTILVNGFDPDLLGHGYIASSRALLTDIHSLLKANAAPAQRFSMQATSSAQGIHWQLRS